MSEVKLELASRSLFRVLNDFVDGKISIVEFRIQYPSAIYQYEEIIEGYACAPLGDLVPLPERKTVDFWGARDKEKPNFWRRITNKFQSKQSDVAITFPNRMSENKLRGECKYAIARLTKEIEARKSKEWIEENLVNMKKVEFSFYCDKNLSRFGDHTVIYSAKINEESFILSALNGSLRSTKFDYSCLLATLRDLNGGWGATWVICTEPDGARTIVQPFSSHGDPFSDYSKLNQLEQTSGQQEQWFACYLILISQNREWMLNHVYNFSEFEIQLHGSKDFIQKVSNSIACT